MIDIKQIILISVLIFVIDMIWIQKVVSGMWRRNIENIQKSPMVINKIYGSLSYLFIIFGILYFVQAHINKDNYINKSLLDGFLYGLILYGVFDFTNLTLFSEFDLKTAIIDMIWGGTLTASVLLFSNHLYYSRMT